MAGITDSARLVKVRYRLVQDNDGWPPATSEDVWAELVEPEVARVDNIPWFVQNLAVGDLIKVAEIEDGIFRPVQRIRWSGNCTIRIIPLRLEGQFDSIEKVIDLFQLHGVSVEGIRQYGILALSIPSDADFGTIKRLLASGEERGIWTYEEGCVGAGWSELQ